MGDNSQAEVVVLKRTQYEQMLGALTAACEQQSALDAEVAELRFEIEHAKQLVRGTEALKRAFVRNVAHELRTPLLQVKSAISMLGEGHPSETTQIVDLAQQATARLDSVVQRVTYLNELIKNSFSNSSTEVFYWQEVIYAVLRNLRRSWEHKDDIERVKICDADDLPPVVGDRHRLVLALQQLVDNALKFSQSGDVLVQFSRASEAVMVSVIDQGIGIADDQHERIFDWFYQVDSSVTRRYGGIGVGLAIVKHVMDFHQTTICVQSSLGRGSVFSFKLPVAP